MSKSSHPPAVPISLPQYMRIRSAWSNVMACAGCGISVPLPASGSFGAAERGRTLPTCPRACGRGSDNTAAGGVHVGGVAGGAGWRARLHALTCCSPSETPRPSAATVATRGGLLRVSEALKGASNTPGSAPRPSIRRHERPRSDVCSGLPPGNCTSRRASEGTARLAMPCIEKTSEAVRPRSAALEADSAAIVADSGYTPPTPTPSTKRVRARK